jgi:hypothetical protein
VNLNLPMVNTYKNKLYNIGLRVNTAVLNVFFNMPDFRLPPRCSRDLRSSGMLRSVDRYLFTDVPGEPIGPIFRGQAALWKWNR